MRQASAFFLSQRVTRSAPSPTPLSAQAEAAGRTIRAACEARGARVRVFCYFSPYLRSKQTAAGVLAAFEAEQVVGVREEPQLREQDFGSARVRVPRHASQLLRARGLLSRLPGRLLSRARAAPAPSARADFQDGDMAARKAERAAYSRFFYRFPNGESGADVYDRITVFEDHLLRDMDAGRFGRDDAVVIVTHGLTLRVFLARWLHWTVHDYARMRNPGNCVPLALERRDARTPEEEARRALTPGRRHTKVLYSLSADSAAMVCADDPALGCVLDPRRDALARLHASIEASVQRRASSAAAAAEAE